jgi:hypothetical protein
MAVEDVTAVLEILPVLEYLIVFSGVFTSGGSKE